VSFNMEGLKGDGKLHHDPDPDNPSIGFTGQLSRQSLLERIERLRRERIEASMPEFEELRQLEKRIARGEEIE
jgi:hypothetical protein